MIDIYIDADACPVKDEVYQVAARHGLYVFLVANQSMRVPAGAGVEMVVVDAGPDVADDWIADQVRRFDVVITGDIPLAARCIERGARVLGSNGRPFDEESIGTALAIRDLKTDLREAGDMGAGGGGPPPMGTRDRSRFSNALEQLVQASLRDAQSG
jgi:uncharacterized protein YaiI (UPF0178 family)